MKEGKIVANLNLLSTEERNLESSYLSIAMRQFGCLDVFNSDEKRKFFSLIFFITINFQEISDFISALKSLPVADLEPQATT